MQPEDSHIHEVIQGMLVFEHVENVLEDALMNQNEQGNGKRKRKRVRMWVKKLQTWVSLGM
jgi:hypothetical protein